MLPQPMIHYRQFEPDEDRTLRFQFHPPPPSPPDSPPRPSAPTTDSEGFRMVPGRPKRDVEEMKIVKETHVIYDWDNGTLPRGYEFSNLGRNMTAALRSYDNDLTITSITACGEYYTLSLNEKDEDKGHISKNRIEHLKNRFPNALVVTVPSRVRTCVHCKKEFPDLTKFSKHYLEAHKSDNYQDKWSRVMDVGDAILARQMKIIQFKAKSPGVFLIISSDSDFVSSAKFLAERGWSVLVAETSYIPSPLREYSRARWTWQNMYRGRDFSQSYPRYDERMYDERGNQLEQPGHHALGDLKLREHYKSAKRSKKNVSLEDRQSVVQVVWDINTCPLRDSENGNQYAAASLRDNINRALHHLDPRLKVESKIFASGDPKLISRDLGAFGSFVTFEKSEDREFLCGKCKQDPLAPKIKKDGPEVFTTLQERLLGEAIDRGSPGIVLLISSDSDFCPAMDFLWKQGFMVILAYQETDSPEEDYGNCDMPNHGDFTYVWNGLRKGEAPKYQCDE